MSERVPPIPSALSAAGWCHRPLLVQCWAADAPDLAPYTDRPGGGLVLTARNGDRCEAYQRARELRERGYRRPMLLDAARYAARDAKDADPADFDLDWLDRQRALGLPVLTDSGYVAEGADEALARVLSATARLGDAIALLALHPSWLVADRKALLRRIGYFRAPVAILLEHVADPFGVPGAVEGLLEVLTCEVPVLLLRTDVSALGALACGAHAAAIGTTAALRHLYPRPWTASEPSVFVRSCLSYKRLDAVEEAKRRDPDAVLWRCQCPTCNDSDLDWILTRPQSEWAGLAARHDVTVQLDLREYLFGRPGAADSSWAELCRAALFQRQQANWGSDPALEQWQRATGGGAGFAG